MQRGKTLKQMKC